MKSARFPKRVVDAIRDGKILGIRAGSGDHRIIGVWVVVVEGRIFIRSWGVKPDGWYRAFVEDPDGLIQVGERKIKVRAVRTRSERLKDLVSRGYRQKYDTPGSVQYVRDMSRPKSRATTIELVPR